MLKTSHSFIFFTTIVSFVFVIIFLKSHTIHIYRFQGRKLLSQAGAINDEVETNESFKDRFHSSAKDQVLVQNKNKSFHKTYVPEDIAVNKKLEPRSQDAKLLEDDELRNGETFMDVQKESNDIIIRYENGMFGLVDSEPTLHVWRAPFSTLGEIWPHPFYVSSKKHIFTLCSASKSLSFKVTGIDNYIIQNAIQRYRKVICNKKVTVYPSNWRQQEHILNDAIKGEYIYKNKIYDQKRKFDSSHSFRAILKGELKIINIFVENSGHQWPSLYMNESYRLSINIKGIFITAKETWGALRALESISQLAWRTQKGRVFINETEIKDHPRFKHRGMMLDTARHFIVKEVLLRNLDAMEMNKMNVFHWHISDDQSFPLITDNHPEFAKYGAYDFRTKVYQPDDVKEIVEYARLRGIRVIPEIDSPSHSLSWRKSHPEVMTRCIDLNGRWTGYYGPLNMASASTYRLLKSLFTDIVHLFPDQWIHLGSDEVPSSCVQSNIAIQRWMQSKGMYSVDFLVDFYTRKLQNIITEIGKTGSKLQRGYIVWQEAYDRNSALKNGTIVQLWKSQSTADVALLARQNIYVIYSSCWYLDRLEYGTQWVNHYICDPEDEGGNMMNDFDNSRNSNSHNKWKQFVLGGEAAMWNEFFDSDNVLQRVWPLASASAERLWSPSTLINVELAAPRLEEMRCRMMIRSIPVGVAGGAGDCGQSDESTIPTSSQSNYIDNPTEDISEISSTILFLQILTNLCNPTFLIFLLMIGIVLCIYFHPRLRFLSTRRVFVIIIVIFCIYSLLWIISQNLI